MKVSVKSLVNQDVKEVEVPETVFGYKYSEHLIHLAVQAYLASQRRGTHKTKGRGEVSGSGRKLWRQKGTGRARVGDIRTPLWRSGGTVHGPQPRSYTQKLTAAEKRNALKSALSRKLAEEQILVVENFDLGSHKTGELVKVLDGLGVDSKALLIDSRDNTNLERAARNNPTVKAVDALSVNVYDVVDRSHLVLSERALNKLVEVLDR